MEEIKKQLGNVSSEEIQIMIDTIKLIRLQKASDELRNRFK